VKVAVAGAQRDRVAVGSIFIDPGSPWQNAWIEAFNSRLRDALLDGWIFDNLPDPPAFVVDPAGSERLRGRGDFR
jgi:hypothetical protein